MGSFGQDFAKGFFGGVDGVRDYTHASKVFRSNAYELKPRFKFLFHVTFTINVEQIPALNAIFASDDVTNLSYVVKTASLPTYTVDTSTLNQYNRKRIIQTKIKYNPVNITFHDDGGDVVRNMWYNYFLYYYKDSSQKYGSIANTNGSGGQSGNKQNGFGGWERDIYNTRQVTDWGYIGESYGDGTNSSTSTSGKPPFFKDIRIAGFDKNHKYAEYVLINPLITAWQHDTYDYSQGNGLMQNSMTIDYETVKYYDKAPNSSAPGFGKNSTHYDQTTSPIARPGSTNSIFGQGGLLDTVDGIANDLSSGTVLGLIGAVQKAGTFYNTNKKAGGLKALIVNEATALGKDALKQALPGAVRAAANKADSWIFPTAQTNTDNTQPAGPTLTQRAGIR